MRETKQRGKYHEVLIMMQKRGFFSFIPVTKHYSVFQCLHRTILSDSGCTLVLNSEKLKGEEEENRESRGKGPVSNI